MESESAPSPARSQASTNSRNGDSGAVPTQRGNDEYNVFRQMLEIKRVKLAIDRLRTELRARYDLFNEGKSSKTSDIAFLAPGTKPENSRRRREKSPQLLPSERRARRRILVRQDRHSPSTTVPGTQRGLKRNQGKILFLTQADSQVVCAVAHSGRATHDVSWGG